MYSINFIESRKKFSLSLHYNGTNGVKIIKFKAKDSEILATSLCLGKVSKYFSVDNVKKTGCYGYVFYFIVYYNVIVVYDILNVHKYLMKNNAIV